MTPSPLARRKLIRSLRTDFSPGLRGRASRARFRLRQASNLPALMLGAHIEQPIFIVGAPRSGTSLLYAILRSSSRLAHWPGEAHEVWEADYHPATRGWDSNRLEPDDLTPRAAARIRRQFFLTTGPKRRLIDKTPRNSLRLEFVDALFPDARYVYLQRDGRANVNSLINAWRTSRYKTYRLPEPHSIPGTDPKWWKFLLYEGWRADRQGPLEVVCARQWLAANEGCLSASRAIGLERWCPVRYEDLVERPVEETERLLGRLGLAFEGPIRARAAATSHTPLNVVTPPERGKWRRENKREIESVLELLRPLMEVLGYDDED